MQVKSWVRGTGASPTELVPCYFVNHQLESQIGPCLRSAILISSFGKAEPRSSFVSNFLSAQFSLEASLARDQVEVVWVVLET